MVWRITVEWLDDEASKPEHVAHGRICHLYPEESGQARRAFHSYWEATEPPMASNDPPYLLNDPRAVHHCISTSIVEGYPRFQGSIWDLVATMLTASGRGWPKEGD